MICRESFVECVDLHPKLTALRNERQANKLLTRGARFIVGKSLFLVGVVSSGKTALKKIDKAQQQYLEEKRRQEQEQEKK
jgi:hypothetical protein